MRSCQPVGQTQKHCPPNLSRSPEIDSTESMDVTLCQILAAPGLLASAKKGRWSWQSWGRREEAEPLLVAPAMSLPAAWR